MFSPVFSARENRFALQTLLYAAMTAILLFLLFICGSKTYLFVYGPVCWKIYTIFVEFYSIVAEVEAPREGFRFSKDTYRFQNRLTVSLHSIESLLELFTEPQEGCTTYWSLLYRTAVESAMLFACFLLFF